MFLAAIAMCAGLACHKSSSDSTIVSSDTLLTVAGTVTYTRIPLHLVDGVPTGYETDTTLFTSLPARGISLRLFQLKPQTDPVTYEITHVWTEVANTITDVNGAYSVTGVVEAGYDTFVELASVVTQYGSNASTITVIADPDGVYSQKEISERPIYVIRKALDGTVMDRNSTHGSVAEGDTTLDFKVGLTDPWQVLHPRWWVPAQSANQTVIVSSDPVAAGSRVTAILDTCYYFAYIYGTAVPSASSATMDFHYRPGLTNRRGTFLEYNIWAFPLAYDGGAYHYFGAISGGGTVDGVVQSDDAFDYGAINPILGRNFMAAQRKNFMVPNGFPTTSLVPDLACLEGFGDAMAATLVGSPYLSGPLGPNRYATPRDIRDLSGLSAAEKTAFSAPLVSALTWDLALLDVGLLAPAAPATWTDIVPVDLLRYYTLLEPTMDSGTTVVNSDCASLFTQLARLQETKTSTDNSDLASTFTNSVLKSICTKFNLTWTTAADAILPKYTYNWGLDPDTAITPLPPIPLSMALATQVPEYHLDEALGEVATNYFPNNSKGEVAYVLFALGMDQSYSLTIETVPALPEGASIEVVLDSDITVPYLFPAGTATRSLPTLTGNPSDLTTPSWHALRIRILSPTVRVADTLVSVGLIPQKTSAQ